MDIVICRRRVIQGCAAAAAGLMTPGAFADQLQLTPPQTEGPFFPDRLPLDTDNDLVIVNDQLRPSLGEITHLTGQILTPAGSPIRNAVVEIWQVDSNGSYLHSRGRPQDKWDSNFQGFGRFLTDSKGRYYFRTIKPVPYPGRTPHIHFKVKTKGQEPFTTQCYIKGEPQNERDGVVRRIRDPKARESVMVDFKKLENSKLGELSAQFDIVLGFTPKDE